MNIPPLFISIGVVIDGHYEERSERLPYKPSIDLVADGYCDTLAGFVAERDHPILTPFSKMNTAHSCEAGCVFTVLSAIVYLEELIATPSPSPDQAAVTAEPVAVKALKRFSSSNIMWSLDGAKLIHDPTGEWVRYSDLAALVPIASAGEPVKCNHDPFEGRCVHCGVRFVDGHPVPPTGPKP